MRRELALWFCLYLFAKGKPSKPLHNFVSSSFEHSLMQGMRARHGDGGIRARARPCILRGLRERQCPHEHMPRLAGPVLSRSHSLAGGLKAVAVPVA